LRERLLDIEQRKLNLIGAIEACAGGQPLSTLVHRLKDLEADEEKIREKLHELEVDDEPEIDLRDAGVAVADFILNFPERFQELLPEVRKVQVRCCVSRIIVD
jgi:hypothetical protein